MKRKRAKSIIEVVKDPKKITWADLHIAKVEGRTRVTRRSTYRNTLNDEVYTHLTGALAWPWERSAGFAVVLAVLKTDNNDKPIFKTVDEAEEQDVFALMERCVELREKWGYGKDGEAMGMLWGDYERFLTLASETSARIRERLGQEEQGFFIIPPIGFDTKNPFEVYLRRIQSCLTRRKDGSKSLYLGPCRALKGYLEVLPADASKYRCRDFPAVAALGYALHSLCVLQPWRRDIAEVASEMGVDIRELATIEQERTIQQLEQGDEEDMIAQVHSTEPAFEDYGAKNTIPGG